LAVGSSAVVVCGRGFFWCSGSRAGSERQVTGLAVGEVNGQKYLKFTLVVTIVSWTGQFVSNCVAFHWSHRGMALTLPADQE